MIPKFRAWDKRRKEMWKVATLHIEDEYADLFKTNIYENPFNDPWAKFEDVILMQSTGLKDKNGVEIYEGDIVRHSQVATDISIVRFGEFGVPNMEEQSYQDCAVGFYYENASEFKDIEPFNMTVPLNSDYVKDVLVVGNIYENPELLNSGIE